MAFLKLGPIDSTRFTAIRRGRREFHVTFRQRNIGHGGHEMKSISDRKMGNPRRLVIPECTGTNIIRVITTIRVLS